VLLRRQASRTSSRGDAPCKAVSIGNAPHVTCRQVPLHRPLWACLRVVESGLTGEMGRQVGVNVSSSCLAGYSEVLTESRFGVEAV